MLNLVEQGFRGIFEQHVGLVEEEHEFRQWQIAYFRQGGIELAQQPQQIGGVELGLHHQLISSQHIHHTLTAFNLHQVADVERRLAEELVCTLCFQLQQGSLNSTDGSRGDKAVFCGVFLGILCHIVEHLTQILQIENQQSALVGNTEHDVQYTVLCLVQLQKA